jgi:tRNA(Ile)-lysidine synthase
MLVRFQKHIAKNFPLLNRKKILIAISGGLDSTVLTHLLHQLKFNISLAHCNFNLRGTESDSDEKFVQELGQQLNIKTFTTSFNTEAFAKENKLSTQIAARELRYEWFEKLVKENHLDYILTAHHADDNLETFLINLTRGTGLDGLTGIPLINKNIVRPLLAFSRNEIEQYAIQNSIAWREDKSNASTKYIRNKIRHQVVPILKEINPSLLDSFQKTSSHLQGSQQIIDDAITEFKKKAVTKEKEVIKISVTEFQKVSQPKAYLFEILKGFGFSEWNDVFQLLSAQSGKFILSKTHRLLKDRNELLLTQISPKNTSDYFIDQSNTTISTPVQLIIEDVETVALSEKHIIFIDKEKLEFPLTIRKQKEGDIFYPSGMLGKKKISKFFKDEKFSLIDKENTWLLCSNNQIVWVIGKRADRRFLANDSTNNILRVSLNDKS